CDDVTAFDDRGHGQTFLGATVVDLDHEILGNIHQAACQVSGVGGFQRGIGQTFTCTVRRDEVLQYVQAFAEVGGNRRFDDGAVGLGHQATHTGQLTNLRGRASRTGVSVNVYGVERLLLLFLAVLIDDRLFGKAIHHG